MKTRRLRATGCHQERTFSGTGACGAPLARAVGVSSVSCITCCHLLAGMQTLPLVLCCVWLLFAPLCDATRLAHGLRGGSAAAESTASEPAEGADADTTPKLQPEQLRPPPPFIPPGWPGVSGMSGMAPSPFMRPVAHPPLSPLQAPQLYGLSPSMVYAHFGPQPLARPWDYLYSTPPETAGQTYAARTRAALQQRTAMLPGFPSSHDFASALKFRPYPYPGDPYYLSRLYFNGMSVPRSLGLMHPLPIYGRPNLAAMPNKAAEAAEAGG